MYDAGELEVHHFDFYRLPDAGIMADELAEIVGDPKAIVVVEWADAVQHVLPDKRLRIVITQTPEGDRELMFTYPDSLQYLIEDLQK